MNPRCISGSHRGAFLVATVRFLVPVLIAVVHLGTATVVGAAGDPEAENSDLFLEDRITSIEIEVPPDAFREMQQSRKFKGQGERKGYLVSVREGAQTYPKVDLHLKGAIGSFRPIDDTPSFTLDFDRHIGPQRFHGLGKISLNNSFQDPARTSERFARELYRKVGVPAPRVGLATVRVNGRDLGVYVLVEGYTRQFLRQHFKNADGNLYDGGLAEDVDPSGNQPVNSGKDRRNQTRLKDLVEASRIPDLAERQRQLEAVLDVDRFLSGLAIDVMLNHWDGYALGRNNYRMFHDLDSNRIVFLPHGLDQTLANAEARIMPRMNGSIAKSLLEIPALRTRYVERVADLTARVFDPKALTERFRKLAAPVGRELAKRDPQAARDQAAAVDDYVRRIGERRISLERQVAGARQPVAFDAQGVAPIKTWESRAEFGRPAFGRDDGGDGPLRIRAENSMIIGCWSAKVWIPRGRYRFEGSLRTRDLRFVPGNARGGAALRCSHRHAAEHFEGTHDWTPVRQEFEVFDPLLEVDLLCEVRGEKGEAEFDPSSLRLVRLGDGR